MQIKVNDVPVVISAQYVNRGEDWTGSRFVGGYHTLEELNADLPRLMAEIPSKHYTLEFEFQDLVTQEEMYSAAIMTELGLWEPEDAAPGDKM